MVPNDIALPRRKQVQGSIEQMKSFFCCCFAFFKRRVNERLFARHIPIGLKIWTGLLEDFDERLCVVHGEVLE